MPTADVPEPSNSQPHLVVINHDEYDQYFVAIEQKLYFNVQSWQLLSFTCLAAIIS